MTILCCSAIHQRKQEFTKKERRAVMFVTVSAYVARTGEEDAIIAIFENWQSDQQLKDKGYLSGELLRNIEDPQQFIAIMRFENRESARVLADDLVRDAWYQRIVSLTEQVPVLKVYTSEWS
jgi:antibiotic biosynthesis monooxygenase (ABM) superfamily enzyme